jgi:hypothetical protein
MTVAIFTRAIVTGCLAGTVACSQGSPPDSPRDAQSTLEPYATAEMIGGRNQFMGGVITPTPSSGEFLVIIELTPSKNADAERLTHFLRGGHPVSLRIREEPDAPPILISDVTSRGEVIIRCKTLGEAEQIVARLHAQRTVVR